MDKQNAVHGLLIATLMAFPGCAGAWGPVGHKVVAMIAQSKLSYRTLRTIRAIMGRDIDLDWIANCPDIFDHSEGHILCAGTVELNGDPEKTKPWHYINIPISDNPSAASLAGYCASGTECVVSQIRQEMHVLQDPNISQQAKQVALVFLVHFVGDAHQPLHCADDHDDGGNLKPVDVEAKGGTKKFLNLHQVWDRAIDNPGEDEDLLVSESLDVQAKALESHLAADLADPLSHPADEIASWTQGDLPSQMVLESLHIAQTVIYPDYASDQGHIADPSDPHEIGKNYQQRMQPIAHRRIEMAGIRLAFMLEQALGAPAPAGINKLRKLHKNLSFRRKPESSALRS